MATWLAWATRRPASRSALAGGRRGAWSQRRRRVDVDPFESLQVQLALSRLDREIEMLADDDDRFARAHHLRAAITAYDDLLQEACRLAGIGSLQVRGSALRRLTAEAELHLRGWDW